MIRSLRPSPYRHRHRRGDGTEGAPRVAAGVIDALHQPEPPVDDRVDAQVRSGIGGEEETTAGVEHELRGGFRRRIGRKRLEVALSAHREEPQLGADGRDEHRHCDERLPAPCRRHEDRGRGRAESQVRPWGEGGALPGADGLRSFRRLDGSEDETLPRDQGNGRGCPVVEADVTCARRREPASRLADRVRGQTTLGVLSEEAVVLEIGQPGCVRHAIGKILDCQDVLLLGSEAAVVSDLVRHVGVVEVDRGGQPDGVQSAGARLQQQPARRPADLPAEGVVRHCRDGRQHPPASGV